MVEDVKLINFNLIKSRSNTIVKNGKAGGGVICRGMVLYGVVRR